MKNETAKSKYIHRHLFIVLAILTAIVAKIFLSFILPDKYLYDSGAIIQYAYGINANAVDKSYMFAANFYKPICYLFHISDAKMGSLIIGLISNLILVFVLSKTAPLQLSAFATILLLVCVFLLNIYVFNISKDFIQFLIDILLLIVIFKVKHKRLWWLLCLAILLLFGILFRSYLIIVGCIFFYFLCGNRYFKNKRAFILLTFTLFLISSFALFKFDKSLFNNVFNIRSETNMFRLNSDDAQTIIISIISGDGYFASIINYFINMIRLIFPIELLIALRISYSLFFLFNICWFYLFVSNRKVILKSRKQKEMLFLFFAFLLVSGLFEPDFGSFLRHLIPICFLTISCVLFKLETDKYSCKRFLSKENERLYLKKCYFGQ